MYIPRAGSSDHSYHQSRNLTPWPTKRQDPHSKACKTRRGRPAPKQDLHSLASTKAGPSLPGQHQGRTYTSWHALSHDPHSLVSTKARPSLPGQHQGRTLTSWPALSQDPHYLASPKVGPSFPGQYQGKTLISGKQQGRILNSWPALGIWVGPSLLPRAGSSNHS